ncbi:alpha-amylase family glycosyl hydrolase [Cellulomonas endophytica]|uniref:alpha-amylase family glycosyl hydrolase n=1 Tax=Cellulomonas endophytica TaxID=2494735 RepID=UPI001013924A|nr:alpha-amylase family glycosyl hydrolase [Cellulomonas endophytica]
MTTPARLRPSDIAITHPDWLHDATIYQINTRQFTPEGTFAAAQAHLPRLADLGVRVLWLMPVHEIGELHRKGTLGSPYAVRDYASVSAELGTREDLRAFVDAAHALGLRVILDWVANHTAWDSVLVERHPDWYVRDWAGRLRPTPWWDWEDVVDLDYRVPELRAYMRDEMVRWVRELDLDGYRCDVAGFVPTDFWEDVRAALDAVKPVVLLAEWEDRELHRRAFDLTYAWSWNEALHHIATGRADVDALRVYYSWNEKAYPADAVRMTFVSNHDKNAWEGTEEEMFGDALEAAIWLSVVGEGMPLVYNGQEAGNDRRLEFFERDPLVWREHPRGELYRRLIALKKEHRALWNGVWGARMVEVVTTDRSAVLAFVRDAGDDAVLAVLNLSPQAREVTLLDGPAAGTWTDAVTGERRTVALGDRLPLDAWGFVVLTR